jgi:hypothetical protein
MSCSILRGIRMYSPESDGKYCYHTGTDKLLNKEDVLKAKEFNDASPNVLRIDILIEVSATIFPEPCTTCCWITFNRFIDLEQSSSFRLILN